MIRLAVAALLAVGIPALAADPAVHYFAKTPDGCTWNLYPTAKRERVTYFKTAVCPSVVLWDATKRQTYFVTGRDLQVLEWGKSAAKKVAKIPAAAREDGWMHRMVVSPSGEILFGTLVPLLARDVAQKDGEAKFQFAGQWYPATDVAAAGQPYMAALYRLADKGKWVQVEARPTNWEGGDTLGLAVIDDFLKEKPGTAGHTLKIQRPAAVRDWTGELAANAPLPAQQKISVAFAKFIDGKGFIDWGKEGGLIFGYILRDTKRIGTPIYACEGWCAKMTKLEGVPDDIDTTLHVEVEGDFALVGVENADALKLYARGRPEPQATFDKTEDIGWHPFGDAAISSAAK